MVYFSGRQNQQFIPNFSQSSIHRKRASAAFPIPTILSEVGQREPHVRVFDKI